IDLDRLNLRVQTDLGPWPAGKRRAGVSSFGMGGTNCHMVLEEAPSAHRPAATRVAGPWVVSAPTEAALGSQARRPPPFLAARPELAPADGAYPLAPGGAVFGPRAVVGESGERLDALAALSDGQPPPDLVTGTALAGRTVFVFPGQGSQWPAMGRHLLAYEPV